MLHLEDIITDIENGSCVLVIGPDLLEQSGGSFFEKLSEELLKDNQISHWVDTAPPQYVFAHEELIQLQPKAKETAILRFLERYYKKQSDLDLPLKKISQIPFHLIISFIPDNRLKRIFEEQNLPVQYGHYPREQSPDPVDMPNKNCPLIYNILGDLNEGDVVFTFDHLFTYLSGIMGDRKLPKTLQETLQKARTFVFLGVHFEKWYYQLLLRIITSKEKEKYTLLKNAKDKATSTFVARRLELDFIEAEPIEFLDQLYNACNAAALLKIPDKSAKARVFISYSHKDMEVAEKIEAVLSAHQITVIRDKTSASGGQKIEDFVSIIKNVDCVISLVSKNSLLSPWVSRETVLSLQSTDVYYLPCSIDEAFLSSSFAEGAKEHANNKLAEIGKRIAERGIGSIEDLLAERSEWFDFNSNIHMILTELRRRICLPLSGDMNKCIEDIIKDVIKNKK